MGNGSLFSASFWQELFGSFGLSAKRKGNDGSRRRHRTFSTEPLEQRTLLAVGGAPPEVLARNVDSVAVYAAPNVSTATRAAVLTIANSAVDVAG
jgi:hypothetical protein